MSSESLDRDAAPVRRIKVTHTASYVYYPEAIEQMWDLLGEWRLLDFVRGDEDTNEETRAMTVYEAMGDSSLSLFHPLQDDDTGYEVEDYDPEA